MGQPREEYRQVFSCPRVHFALLTFYYRLQLHGQCSTIYPPRLTKYLTHLGSEMTTTAPCWRIHQLAVLWLSG